VITTILKKIGYNLLVLIGALTVVFFLFQLKPGNAARGIAGNNASEDIIKLTERKHNLDLPVFQQYLLYLNDISPISIHNPTHEESRLYLDTAKYDYVRLVGFSDSRTLVFKTPYLRTSYQNGQSINEKIVEALPGTVMLALAAILLASVLGITMGVFAAIWKGSFFDNGALVIGVLGMSAPSYFSAIIIAWIGGFLWFEEIYLPLLPILIMTLGIAIGTILNKKLNKNPFKRFSWDFLFQSTFKFFTIGAIIWVAGYAVNALLRSEVVPGIKMFMYLPGTGLNNTGSLYETDDLGNSFLAIENIILPALTLGIRPLAVILQLTRSSMLEVLSQDYIRTAKAKGLSMSRIIVRHALKNALNPVITAISGWFAAMLAGAVFIEVIFSWKGLGLEVYNGLIRDDYPIVLGSVVVIATSFVLINMVVDIVYTIIDPRIRVKA